MKKKVTLFKLEKKDQQKITAGQTCRCSCYVADMKNEVLYARLRGFPYIYL